MESQNSQFSPAGVSAKAEELLAGWLRDSASPEAIQKLTPTERARLLEAMQHILADTGEVNLDHQDIWEILSGAVTLQFGVATISGRDRATVISPQLWAGMTALGTMALPARRMLMAIHSGPTAELEMDELTEILEYSVAQAGGQAEIVFGHGIRAELGSSIQVILLVSRH